MVAASYLDWGWPVTVRGNQVVLALGAEVAAIVLPAGLADAVLAVLDDQHCSVIVLADPGAPEHRVLLAGEPFGMLLPWPAGAHSASGSVALPPSRTPRGPVIWQRPPAGSGLRTCREIDIFAAVRATLRTPTQAERAVR